MSADYEKDMHACSSQTGPEHESLARFAGTWRAEVSIWMDPAGEPAVSTGTMTNTLVLGGRFLQQEYSDDADMFAGKGFWGYNDVDKRYEGLWIDSMSNMFHLEQGTHDAAADTYTMTGSMTSPQDGKPMGKRSLIAFESADEHSIEMFFQPAGQAEFKAMEIRYKRG